MNEIQLEFKRNVFEEIYFKNNKGNIFLSPNSKGFFLILTILSFALILLSFYCIKTDKFIFGLVVLFLIWIVAAYNFIRVVVTIIRWKKGVNNYLDELAKSTFYKILLTETAFSVIFDKNEVIEKWSAIKQASISEEFIDLKGTQSYLFPKKSMSSSDYELFKGFISQKLKQS